MSFDNQSFFKENSYGLKFRPEVTLTIRNQAQIRICNILSTFFNQWRDLNFSECNFALY